MQQVSNLSRCKMSVLGRVPFRNKHEHKFTKPAQNCLYRLWYNSSTQQFEYLIICRDVKYKTWGAELAGQKLQFGPLDIFKKNFCADILVKLHFFFLY